MNVSHVSLLRRAEAELVVRRMHAGRHKPLLVHARCDNGNPVLCVVKPVNRLTLAPTEYLLEWIAAAVANALGVLVPEPLAIVITDELASAVDAEFQLDVRSSIGLVYGSSFVGKPFTQLPNDYVLSPDQREAAARLLAFDVYIHNADRRADNHNLFVDRSRVLAFDHESAFSFLLPILGAADPVVDPALDIVQRHALAKLLKGKMPALDAFRSTLESLDDAFFGDVVRATPAQWTEGQASGKLDRIVDVLQKRRDAVERWLPQVQAWLDR